MTANWTSAHHGALNAFFNTFTAGTAADLGVKLTCDEVEALADLMRTCGRPGLAATWINAHSHGDDEGDRHHRTPGIALVYELEQLAGTVPGIELEEGDPDAFADGHLTLVRGQERFAFTEYNDQPDDDTNVTGWDWEQTHRSPSGGPRHIDATGRHTAEQLDALVAAARAWATH